MSLIPDGLKYTIDHEWVRIEGDVATIGITDYAQGELGDIVHVELPLRLGSEFSNHDTFAIIQANKTVSDLFCPVKGTIME